MAGRLNSADFAEGNVSIAIPPGAPDDGDLVAVYRAARATDGPVLLLAHLDVVEAKPCCRVLQGHTAEEVKADLERVLADPEIRVVIERRREGSSAPPLTAEIMGPVERAAARIWPRVPIVPTMTVGATDGRFPNSAGIPTYGMSGMFRETDGNNAHGLNERLRVRSF